MIPSMILLGLVLGRWWRTALVTSAVVWLLLAWGPVRDAPGALLPGLALAVLAGVANAAVGVAVHQALLWVVRRGVRRFHSWQRPGTGSGAGPDPSGSVAGGAGS